MSNAEAKFEFGKLRDGGIVMMCSQDFSAKVKQVEYYSDAKIFILTFFNPIDGNADYMIQYELKDDAAQVIDESLPETILLVEAKNRMDIKGYNVPLIKSGSSN